MKNILRFKTFCVAMMLLSVQSMAQTIYYVSPTGVDTDPGTIFAPFKTLTKAISVTSNGSNTIIYLRGGTHNYTTRITIANTKNGTALNRLRIFAYPGDERPVLNFSGMLQDNSNSQGIMLRASYWHLKGFDIFGAGDNGLKIEGGAYNIVENCAFYENDDTGLQIDDGANNNQIINCDSYFNKDAADGNADGYACKLLAGTGNSFKGCRAWQNSDDGWDGLLTADSDISTTYDSCWCFLNGYLKTGVASKGNGNGFKMGGNQMRHNARLTRCVAVANRVKGFDQNNNTGDMILYNCTGYINSPNYGMNNINPATGKVMEIRNSISYAGKSGDVFRAVAIRTNNSWQAPFVTNAADFISLDTSQLRAPRKPDGSLPDINLLHLVPGSDLIDGGLNVGLPFVGSAPDLGAFETQPMLPVKLTSFLASNSSRGVLLQWNLATETNNKGWHVERSLQGANAWTDLGFVTGAGNSNTLTSYSYLDTDPVPGTYFYRLRQTDVNGNISYSNILLVVVGKKAAGIELAGYPNPFKTASTIRFSVPSFAKVTISLYTGTGQLVKTISNRMMDAGTHQQLLQAPELAPGKYILKLQVGAEWVTTYLMKL